MESDERLELYNDLISRYSKAFYKRVSNLFELEDLAQEMWKCILEVEANEKEKGSNRTKDKAFVVTCLRNHMINHIKREFQKNNTIDANKTAKLEDYADVQENVDIQAMTKERVAILSDKVEKIKDGRFVLENTILGFTIREIATLGKSQGMKMSRSKVNYIQHKVKNIANKLFLDISVL